jgi:hypothetical protein
VIRFSAALVVVAIGVLIGGMAASSLLLVYVAIGLSVVALLTLALGVALKREEIFGEQGQSALVGQGVNAGFEQERPGSAASAERSAAPGRQDVYGERFGQHAAAFGQAAWAAAPDMHSGLPGGPSSPSHSDAPTTSAPRTGAGAPWSPPAAPAAPETPPWRERFASPAPQRPAAQTRVDTALTRADLAKTRTDMAEAKAGLTEAKADPTEAKADPAPGRSAALDWFDRIASAQPADDIEAEDAGAADSPVDVASVDEADSPAGDANAGTEDATTEAEAADTEDATTEAEAADTNAAANTVVGNTVVGDTIVRDTVAEPSTAGSDAEPEAEDGVPAEASDSSADGDQENRSGQREVTVVPGVPRYHDANCILIRFMGDDDLQKMTLDEATEAGCTPCRACVPEHA